MESLLASTTAARGGRFVNRYSTRKITCELLRRPSWDCVTRKGDSAGSSGPDETCLPRIRDSLRRRRRCVGHRHHLLGCRPSSMVIQKSSAAAATGQTCVVASAARKEWCELGTINLIAPFRRSIYGHLKWDVNLLAVVGCRLLLLVRMDKQQSTRRRR